MKWLVRVVVEEAAMSFGIWSWYLIIQYFPMLFTLRLIEHNNDIFIWPLGKLKGQCAAKWPLQAEGIGTSKFLLCFWGWVLYCKHIKKTRLLAIRKAAMMELASWRDRSQWEMDDRGRRKQHSRTRTWKAHFIMMLTSILDVLQKAPTGWTWS